MDIILVCYHGEEAFQQARSVNAEGKYATTRVVGFDSSEDTIILSVDKINLKNYPDDGACAQAHPPLEISPNTPINDM